MNQLLDRFGRRAEKLRISVTDRCNFRCQYCMPEEGLQWLKRAAMLTYEEITALVRVFASLGITRIRLTGGEPLLRKDLPHLVAQLVQIPGIEKIALTTNGYALAKQARPLYEAGLRSFNISLDSLDPARFKAITRTQALEQVLRGVQALADLPGCEIKLNVVLMRGLNEQEAEDFGQLAYEKPYSVRFIEFMPIGGDDNWSRERVVPGHEILERLGRIYTLEKVESAGKNPAERWRLAGGQGELGFINSVTEPFCHSCDRIRLTCDGQLRTCLFATRETDLRQPLREGADQETLRRTIAAALWAKEAGHLINQPQFQKPARTMSAIGG